MEKQANSIQKKVLVFVEKMMEQDDASPERTIEQWPAIQAKGERYVREPASAYRLGSSSIFSLAPGGFKAHEGHIILTSRDEEKEIHVLERHGTTVTAAFLKSRLFGVLDEFYRLREQKARAWENALVSAHSRLARKAERSDSDLTTLQKDIEEIEKLEQKMAWAWGIQSHQREQIMRFLHDEARRREIPFRATKFYKSETMRHAVMAVLKSNQEQIDARLTDKNGNPKAVGTQAGPFRQQFPHGIGIGYELNEKMEIVEMSTLTKVAVILIISDQKKRYVKVLTAYPEA